ncbi:T9SS type A sorting domain-containing protein [bacterium]|nr:T9SS type A sorting domain-containing protein [bacterium]
MKCYSTQFFRPSFLMFLAALVLILPVKSFSAYMWHIDNLNNDTSAQGSTPSIASDGTYVYVAYDEHDGPASDTPRHTYVKQSNGSEWTQLGGSLNIATTLPDTVSKSNYPDILCTSSEIWAAFSQYDVVGTTHTSKIVVSSWAGSSWENRGILYNNTDYYCRLASISQYNDIVYVAWKESPVNDIDDPGNVYVKRFNGGSWEDLGAVDDSGLDATNEDIVVDPATGTPYVVYLENYDVIVKSYNGTWNQVGTGSASSETYNYNPTVDHDGANLTVSFAYWVAQPPYSTRMRGVVRTWNGSIWAQVGTTINIDNESDVWYSTVKLHSGTPYVCFTEGHYMDPPSSNYLRMYNGSAWETVCGPLRYDFSTTLNLDTDMAFFGDIPFIVWNEDQATTGKINAFVARLATPTPTPTITPTITVTSTCTPVPPGSTPSFTSTPTSTMTPTVTPFAVEREKVIAYPNPAKGAVTFVYRLETVSNVLIQIYDISGNKVACVTESAQAPGSTARAVWNAKAAGSGIYLCRIVIDPLDGSGKIEKTLKIAIVK